MNCLEKISYAKLREEDLMEKIMPQLKAGNMRVGLNGKIVQPLGEFAASETPWVHVKQAPARQCGLWHQVFFNIYGFIPIGCMRCWKVVVRPQTLEDLFKLYFFQKKLDRPSKCGFERRSYVFGNYGGYFYNDSLAEGLERWKEVKDAVDSEIGNGATVILKRGCTEFERKFPRSSTWAPFEGQFELETKLSSMFQKESPILGQPPVVRKHVMKKWVEYAHSIGDPTYLKFTDGMKIFGVPYETYHVDEPEDAPLTDDELTACIDKGPSSVETDCGMAAPNTTSTA